jgi:hypothetical protein
LWLLLPIIVVDNMDAFNASMLAQESINRLILFGSET